MCVVFTNISSVHRRHFLSFIMSVNSTSAIHTSFLTSLCLGSRGPAECVSTRSSDCSSSSSSADRGSTQQPSARNKTRRPVNGEKRPVSHDQTTAAVSHHNSNNNINNNNNNSSSSSSRASSMLTLSQGQQVRPFNQSID